MEPDGPSDHGGAEDQGNNLPTFLAMSNDAINTQDEDKDPTFDLESSMRSEHL